MSHFLQISIQQIGLILLILVFLFGAKKIPELMRGLGSGIKEFKDATKEQDSKPKDENQDA